MFLMVVDHVAKPKPGGLLTAACGALFGALGRRQRQCGAAACDARSAELIY